MNKAEFLELVDLIKDSFEANPIASIVTAGGGIAFIVVLWVVLIVV